MVTINRLAVQSAAMAVAAVLGSTPARAADISVVVEGASATGGDIRAELCTQQEFLSLRCSRIGRAIVSDHRATLNFVAPPGRYAIAVFHDRYRDGRIHRSFIGIPKQGVGFSRNPLLFGSPSFSRTAFDVAPAGASIVVRLRFEPTA